MNKNYSINEIKLDIDELYSQIKVLQTAIQNEYGEISKKDIDYTLEIIINKLNLIKRNMDFIN